MIERTFPAEPERPLFSANLHFTWIVRMLAHLFSIVFHPLFIPVMAAYYLVFIQPGYFTEKISECYLTHTLPIYFGCPNI